MRSKLSLVKAYYGNESSASFDEKIHLVRARYLWHSFETPVGSGKRACALGNGGGDS